MSGHRPWAAGGVAIASASLANTSAKAASPGTFRDCRGCPEMVVIPAGRFEMGSGPAEERRDPLEGPRHAVNVGRFAAGRFDVTRTEWRAFVAATQPKTIDGCQWSGPSRDHEASANWRRLGFKQDDSHPVVCVTWFDARYYAAWLTRKTGRRYRLLSEAE